MGQTSKIIGSKTAVQEVEEKVLEAAQWWRRLAEALSQHCAGARTCDEDCSGHLLSTAALGVRPDCQYLALTRIGGRNGGNVAGCGAQHPVPVIFHVENQKIHEVTRRMCHQSEQQHSAGAGTRPETFRQAFCTGRVGERQRFDERSREGRSNGSAKLARNAHRWTQEKTEVSSRFSMVDMSAWGRGACQPIGARRVLGICRNG